MRNCIKWLLAMLVTCLLFSFHVAYMEENQVGVGIAFDGDELEEQSEILEADPSEILLVDEVDGDVEELTDVDLDDAAQESQIISDSELIVYEEASELSVESRLAGGASSGRNVSINSTNFPDSKF